MTRKREGVMLAHPAEQKYVDQLGSVFYMQPKLKGNRAKAEGGNLLSSTGIQKPFFWYIKEQLAMLPDLIYDGELYKHGMEENEISSICNRSKNQHPSEGIMEYHIFDIAIPEIEFSKRLTMLNTLAEMITNLNLTHIKVVPTVKATRDNWFSIVEDYCNLKYEGGILRKASGLYEFKRSKNLLKSKPTETDIYKIVGVQQGTGWCYDRLGAFTVKDKNGVKFNVGTGPELTADLRMFYWNKRQSLAGKYLLVKHEFLKTKNQVPVATVAYKVLTDQEVMEFKKQKHNDL